MADMERTAPTFNGSPADYEGQILRLAEREARIPVRSIESVRADTKGLRARRRHHFEQPRYDTPEDDMMRVLIDALKDLDKNSSGKDKQTVKEE